MPPPAKRRWATTSTAASWHAWPPRRRSRRAACNAAQHSLAPAPQPAWDYSTESYTDTYSDPQVAYDESVDALRRLSDGFRALGDTTGAAVDSLNPRTK